MKTRAATLGAICALAFAPQVFEARSAPAAWASARAHLQTPSASSAAADSDASAIQATLDRYCVTCHRDGAVTAATASGVVLQGARLTRVAQDAAMWEKVVRRLRTGTMPPAGAPRPDPESLAQVVGWIERTLDAAATRRPSPGRPGVHRLNRTEYANAIRDLLDFEVDTAALLPPDDSANGFDNNAGVLGTSPALLERYLSAAAKISALAVASPRISASSETYRVRGDASQAGHDEGLPLGTRGGIAGLHTFPLDGEYVIKVKLLETNLGSIRGLEHVNQLEITVDGERVLLAPVGGPDDYQESARNAANVVMALDKQLQARVHVRAGQRRVTAAFLQKSAALGPTRLQPFIRSTVIATDHLGLPHVEHMTVLGPFNPTGAAETPSRQRVFTCRPARQRDERQCARSIVTTLARRAYRRPVAESDVAPLMEFYEVGREESFDAGIELALRALLASPKFVFRTERTPAGAASGTIHPVSDLDLASRVSFFLWSSIPDEELLTLAEKGLLHEPEVLAAQVRRMLADDKANALVENFAGQWLHVRNLRSTTPDKNDFPDFDDNLRRAFERELHLFIASVVSDDRSVLDLLTADHTFVNERLARHYGMPHVTGSHFRRVSGIDDYRRGLLGKGGILLVTSHADRTAPVVRGKWILDNLLGMPPAPPPPDVPQLPEAGGTTPLTMRERMERHRASPVCAGCHRVMDPIGLALENFDAVGAWRTHDAGEPIDASGVMGDGTTIDGVAGLRAALLQRPEVFVGTMTEKLLTYALGRGVDHHDMPAVRAIVRDASRHGYRFSALVEGVVLSVPFRMTRAE